MLRGWRRWLGTAALVVLATGCATTPRAVTIGQTTIHLRRHPHLIESYLVEIHEAAHRRQYRERGIGGLLWNYVLRPSERLKMEAEAHAAALCQAEALGANPVRLDAIRATYARWLRSYLPDRPMTPHVTRAYLDAAFRDGEACEELLAPLDIPSAPSEVVAMLRERRGPPDRVATLVKPPVAPRARGAIDPDPVVLPRVPAPSLAAKAATMPLIAIRSLRASQ